MKELKLQSKFKVFEKIHQFCKENATEEAINKNVEHFKIERLGESQVNVKPFHKLHLHLQLI